MNTATLGSPQRHWPARLRVGAQIVAGMVVMSLGALLLLLIAMLTGFRLRRFYSETVAAAIGRALLAIFGVHFVVHQRGAYPQCQLVYISNHTSTIDMFVLIAMGLPDARFFLSGYLRKLLPLGVIGYLIGIFWTLPQERQAERRRIFAHAAAVLRKTGESVYLSPEGERITTGRIGAFNKGAFHLATALRAPIVPIFIRIPPQIDPGRGIGARPGRVDVYVGEPIDTRGWQVADVMANRDRVRAHYERWHAQLHQRERP